MLAKCVNPSCSNRFKHLREGRLLRVEKIATADGLGMRKSSTLGRAAEYYWLCGPCSGVMNLAFDGASGIILIPLASLPSTAPTLDRPRASSVASGVERVGSRRIGPVPALRNSRRKSA